MHIDASAVSVIGLAHEDLCRVGIFVWVRWGERDVLAPLARIVPLSGDEPTRVAVADCDYWHVKATHSQTQRAVLPTSPRPDLTKNARLAPSSVR
ncbi:calcium-binding protein [Paraburkholderia sp. RL17-337-BIB-A]|uniref:calcium-binding protein n=1 Tax=Paraburkholderia sp. RL17-337-BIB-A TaxID=3031636 RepID=UPI0038BBF9A0